MTTSALLMPVGSDWYAVGVEHVREVVGQPRITKVPTAPPRLLGLFNLRGEIVPLLDTGLLLGLEPIAECSQVTVLFVPLGVVGLAVTGLPESVELGEPASTSDLDAGLGSYRIGRRMATLLDPERLLGQDLVEEPRS